MSNPTDPRREYPNTYFVQDRSNEEEAHRLQIQDQMTTAGMGGVLPEQPDPTIFRRVLDVGCGTGSWLIEAAKTYPSMSLLIGAEVSGKMVEYARAQAKAQQVSDRVEFHVMDALRMLEFPTGYFDLVNHRFGQSWLRTWDWPNLLREYRRVTQQGGIIRVTESDFNVESNSPALTRLFELLLAALYRAGNFFTPQGDGVITELARLLKQHGFENVQTRPHTIIYRASEPAGQHFYQDMKGGFRTTKPFIHKWLRVTDDYEAIYQQALIEMQQPDFVATWRLLTAWGQAPGADDKHGYDYPR